MGAMKVIERRRTWEQAQKALAAGKLVNHQHWNANKPHAARGYVGPTALALFQDRHVIVTDDGVVIHDWNDTPDEKASKDWQIVEIRGEVHEAKLEPSLIVPATEADMPPRRPG